MKKLLLVFTLLFPITSYAQWGFVLQNKTGNDFYINTDIKENDEYVYYWQLLDFAKPKKTPYGSVMSVKSLNELDCKTPRREKVLSAYGFESPMGKGQLLGYENRPQEWKYMPPGSSAHDVMDFVCNLATK